MDEVSTILTKCCGRNEFMQRAHNSKLTLLKRVFRKVARPCVCFVYVSSRHQFPRSSDMIDAMTQDEIAAFANWYGINGTMIPVGDNLQHRRAAVRRYGASLQEEFAQED